jgi:hypothetical protein
MSFQRLIRRNPFTRNVYLGVPPQQEAIFYEYGRRPSKVIIDWFNRRNKEEVVAEFGRRPEGVVVVDDVYNYLPFLYAVQPQPNYELNDQIINEITYRILTTVTQYKPKREVEIAPVTRMKINLG